MDIIDLIMILRLQIGCAFFTILIAIPFFTKKRVVSFVNKLFRYVLIFQFISLSFDMLTVYTVNNLEMVPALINKLCHIIFIGSLCCFIFLVFLYIRNLVTEDHSKKTNILYGIPVFVSIIILIFAPLHYVETERGNYSAGPGANVVYGTVAVYIVLTLYLMLRYWSRIDSEKRQVLMVALLSKAFFSLLQLFIPTILISGLGSSLVTLAIYLMIENPDRILKNRYRKENIDLQGKVHIDPLTGIFNRRYLEENLSNIIMNSAGGEMSVLMIDIDCFKKYNDTYGHAEGDACLCAVAEAIKNSVTRSCDFAARYGGEEFTVVLPNTGAGGARIIANRILESVRNLNIPHENNTAAVYVTLSIGVYTGEIAATQTGAAYIKLADEALYASKKAGRNRVTVYSDL